MRLNRIPRQGTVFLLRTAVGFDFAGDIPEFGGKFQQRLAGERVGAIFCEPQAIAGALMKEVSRSFAGFRSLNLR